ncbi:MAG: 5'-3' exoribonuclease 2 [Piccolia ochrophora]|nr:MAG: 5'-3' exoribonuclease 2 [Piccolia ochrophora]
MGVPALFRWLSQKYPKIISPVIEEQPREIEGQQVPVDTTAPNPNGEEMDNLYLDMNGIVHPCSHPEDRPPPATEGEMMLEVFKYTERVVNMVRPRKLLMIAVDGVAPRAKMNQQRSRRFRSAQEAKEKDEDKAEFEKLLKARSGGSLDESITATLNKKTWDSNAITPGTPFMDILAKSLRYWTAYKLNTDPAWAKMKVIISDATVPGEGEHKIMEFIRSQRSSPEHDPNTRHVIYGLDADLIMLGLATHEPHFRVLREDVFFQESKARACRICGQKGHKAEECKGEAKSKDGEYDEKDKAHPLKPFIWLHVSVLREYLAAELYVPSQQFAFDLERALDDWVFMCFFVGNDFLPHLPSLDIRENGIDTLIAIWRDNIPIMGSYLTKDGHVDYKNAQHILNGLAKQEDAIFRRRRQTEERRDNNAKRRKLEDQNRNSRATHGTPSHNNNNVGRRGSPDYGLSKTGGTPQSFSNVVRPGANVASSEVPSSADHAKVMTHDMIMNRGVNFDPDLANKSAAAVLKSQLLGSKSSSAGVTEPETATDGDHDSTREDELGGKDGANGESPSITASTHGSQNSLSILGKRKSEVTEPDHSSTPGRTTPNVADTPAPAEDEPPPDNVRLWEEGYADRYYEHKFHVDPKDMAFRRKVAEAYVEGLSWVLLYYFQGCPSWTWYYPYHYAPFAADFTNIESLKITFDKGTPFRPFEQLMGVLPAASKHAIPEAFHGLMTEEDSEIIDFYPEDFPIDLNGKKFAWQGVALLPFIDEHRLLDAMAKIYPLLPAADAARNEFGKDALLFSDGHPLYEEMATTFYSKRQGAPKYKLNPRVSEGLAGKVEKNESFLPQSSLGFPLEEGGMPDVDNDRSMSVYYDMPHADQIHKSMLLRGVKFPPTMLTNADIEATKGRASRSGRQFGGAPMFERNRGGGGRGRGGSINYGVAPPPPFPGPPPGGRGGSWNQTQNRGGLQQWGPPPPGVAPPGVGPPGNAFPYPPPPHFRGPPPPPLGPQGGFHNGYPPFPQAAGPPPQQPPPRRKYQPPGKYHRRSDPGADEGPHDRNYGRNHRN